MATQTLQKGDIATPKKDGLKKDALKKNTPKKDTPKKTATKYNAPVTPTKKDSATAKAEPTPKKKKEPVKYTALEKDKNAPIPVEVSFLGESAHALGSKQGIFSHSLKLEASVQFSLYKTIIIQSGEHEGAQAIVLQAAKAFQFKSLTEELRQMVYKEYFAPQGDLNGAINFEGKRKKDCGFYAKSYAEGSKNRVALMAVDKEIHCEAMKVLYAQKFYVTDTQVLLDFISSIPPQAMPLLREIRVKSILKNNRTTFSFMQEAKFLNKLRLEQWYYHDDDMIKAAKIFWNDAGRFLEAIASVREKMTHRTLIEEEEEDEVHAEQGDTNMAEADSPATPVASNTEEPFAHTAPDADADTSMTSSADGYDADASTFAITDSSLFSGTVITSATPGTQVKKAKKQPRYRITQGKRSDAIDVLEFGLFSFKDADTKEDFDWSEEMEEQFKEALKAKLA